VNLRPWDKSLDAETGSNFFFTSCSASDSLSRISQISSLESLSGGHIELSSSKARSEPISFFKAGINFDRKISSSVMQSPQW
jgi:hypothetical protein